MGVIRDAYTLTVLKRRFGDLISYQNDRKYRTGLVDMVGRP